jgi:hypothetical protein
MEAGTAKPQQRDGKRVFTTETAEYAEFRVFLIKILYSASSAVMRKNPKTIKIEIFA